MKLLSLVMPAFNEAPNLPSVRESIPLGELRELGWDVELLVVDNASTDATGDVARALGARVIFEPKRGYGNAYQAGFAATNGEVIATGDADRTYPFETLPQLLKLLESHDIEFLTTNRLVRHNRAFMKTSHLLANHALSAVSRSLFRNELRDSQSGMWIFRSYVWDRLDVRSRGMAFSQEIKNAATLAGFRYLEVPIEYRKRGGEAKLNALTDGMNNIRQLFEHRFRKVTPVPVPSTLDSLDSMASA